MPAAPEAEVEIETVEQPTSLEPGSYTTPAPAATTQSIVVELVQRRQGASIAEIDAVTSWTEASARGFLSAGETEGAAASG